MGIKLDWQVESEQTRVEATEDPAARRQRRRARNRLLLLIIGLGAVVALIAALIIWRLDRLDEQIKNDLVDTVQVEVTALRIGDYANFMAVQRSASETFLLEQSQRFETYQQLKQTNQVELPGTVVDVTIDNLRGRVVVEEIIDGVPYHVVWFYWYYEEGGESGQKGWRHVPADLTFWGGERELDREHVRVVYREMDALLAEVLASRLEEWWTAGCAQLGCLAELPRLRVEIVAEHTGAVQWDPLNDWSLQVASPLVDRARADAPVPPVLEQEVVAMISERLAYFATGTPLGSGDATDSAWLHGELARWLAGQLLNAPDPGGFVETLLAQYGLGAVNSMVQTTLPTLDIALTAVTGVSMPLLSTDQLNNLAWADFFQWRLVLEFQLLNQPDSGGLFLTLYDQEQSFAYSAAQLRLEDPAYAARPVPQVMSVDIVRDEQSQTYAYVGVSGVDAGAPESRDVIVWRLAGGTWKRAS